MHVRKRICWTAVVVDSWWNARAAERAALARIIHSGASREEAPSEGGDIHAWGYEAGETTIGL